MTRSRFKWSWLVLLFLHKINLFMWDLIELTCFLRDVIHGKPMMVVGRMGVYCSEYKDCPGTGVIVGMPTCCDLSNLPPTKGQSWLLFVWNGTLLVFSQMSECHNLANQIAVPAQLLESWTFHCHDCHNTHHPYGGVTRPVWSHPLWCHDWKVFCKWEHMTWLAALEQTRISPEHGAFR